MLHKKAAAETHMPNAKLVDSSVIQDLQIPVAVVIALGHWEESNKVATKRL